MHSFKLPLFPLNSVLFPGVPIFLHIFEDRYRKMINHCIDNRQPFGVVMIEEGVEAYGEAQPVQVGCSAEIVQVERMDDGRMNIVAVGQDRFRILTTTTENAYMEGEVERFPLQLPESNAALTSISGSLRPGLETYISTLREVSDIQISWKELPGDAVELAWLAAYVLQVPSEEKQKFLNEASAIDMMKALRRAYHIETKLLESMIAQSALSPEMGSANFSLN